jgi:HPt (histidine-containing phosphotransfer) domain-containing protein
VRHRALESAVNLDELLGRVENDHKLLQHLVVIFKRDYPLRMSTLRNAIVQGDLKAVEISSHTLKGMFLSLAAPRSADSAAELERLGRNRDTSALPGALTLLETEVERLLAELESYMAKVET